MHQDLPAAYVSKAAVQGFGLAQNAGHEGSVYNIERDGEGDLDARAAGMQFVCPLPFFLVISGDDWVTSR